MSRRKRPLPELLEANKAARGIIWGWREFDAIARQEKRPSYKALSNIFGPSDVTMKAWLKRWDAEKRE